ncbi:transcription factor MYB97-like [Hibiscus syriacus]|uniref:transcription factor MYB97-like n=1 Tax=Hibiscus syriacus TaxID=106335 RepID=UPI00192243E1|nr:transcription factor MYB97-like [Hibiscus syriacus]
MMIGETNSNNHVGTQNEGGGLRLKKGPWTAAEDAILAEHVRTHGEGNWNAVRKNAGLARCGKSCRLRWANHLRPNLKKGAFSPEEERIIVEMHAIMGNKWARMATRLPGRSDNEIKNFWNTRVKRRQRQGLPLYPPEIQALYSSQHRSRSPVTPSTIASTTPPFSLQNPMMKPLQSSMLQSSASHPNLMAARSSQHHLYDPNSSATPPPSLQSPSRPPLLLSPSHFSPLHAPSSLDFHFPRTPPSLQHPLRHKRFKPDVSHENNNNGGSNFMLPFSFLMKTDPFNHNSLNPQQYSNTFTLDQTILDLASSWTILEPYFDPGQFMSTPGFDFSLKNELPSNQFFSQDDNKLKVTLDPKGNNDNYSSNDGEHHSSSLNISENDFLEDMLKEAQAPLPDNNEIIGSQSCLASGFLKAKEQIMNIPKHEDYSNMNPSSMAMAVPDWYIDKYEGSNWQSRVETDGNLGFELELYDQKSSLLPVDTAPDDHGRSQSSYYWNHDFPGIC